MDGKTRGDVTRMAKRLLGLADLHGEGIRRLRAKWAVAPFVHPRKEGPSGLDYAKLSVLDRVASLSPDNLALLEGVLDVMGAARPVREALVPGTIRISPNGWEWRVEAGRLEGCEEEFWKVSTEVSEGGRFESYLPGSELREWTLKEGA